MAVKGIGSNSLYSVQNDYTPDSKTEDRKNVVSQTAVQKEGGSYERTIPDSVSAGLEYIQGMEKQISGTKFLVGTVSYGQTYDNSSDVNFVVNPKFLSKLGTDEAARKEFEDGVKFLNDFSKRFKEQQLAQGREIISQGWFCDEDGNWGGWTVSRPIKQSTVLQDMADNAEKIRLEKLEERKKAEAELKEHFAEITGDMQEVKAGIEKGWCDESEMDKVNSLMSMAQSKMGQVEDREATPEEENMFAMASLM